MLLHEMGHIVHADHAVAFDNGAFVQLNLEPSLAKASEERADEFAARLLRQGSRRTDGSGAALAATAVSVEITKLSWNQQAYRSLDEFGAAAVAKQSVFLDAGFVHPNLAWRILRVNALIQETPASRQLLEDFEATRRRSPNPQSLYPAPGVTK